MVSGQTIKSHNNNLYVNYIQLKDQMNYGLVFSGPGINYAYSYLCQNDRRLISYEGKLGIAVMQTHEIPAFNVNITPLHLSYLIKFENYKNIKAGFFLISEYNNQFNPDLQSGILFWHTHLSLGPVIKFAKKIAGYQFEFSANTSLLGFNSRQPVDHDPYFWEISYGDLIKPHLKDLSFCSLNKFNYSEFEIGWIPSERSRVVIAYNLKYIGYHVEPMLDILNQSVKLIIRSKSK
jgi:hypothetical protein